MKQTSFSILKAATELGVARETLRKRLVATGADHAGPYSLKEIVSAMTPTDANSARARLHTADAELRELELQRERGETVTLAEVDAAITRLHSPLRNWIVSLPQSLSVRCNTEHPEVARVALEQARDEFLKLVRDTVSNQ